RPSGLKAFEARKENRSGIYSYENRPEELPEPYISVMKEDSNAWEFYQSRSPSYQKTTTWWVVSAKKEETRMKRLRVLAEYSSQQETIPQLTSIKGSTESRPKEV